MSEKPCIKIIAGNAYTGDGQEARILAVTISDTGQPTELDTATFALIIQGHAFPIPTPTLADGVLTITLTLTTAQTSLLYIGSCTYCVRAYWGANCTDLIHNAMAIVC
jgi:hypothetical protein